MLEHGDYSTGTKSHYNSTRTTSAELFPKNSAPIKTQSGGLRSRQQEWKTIDLSHNNAHQLRAHTKTQRPEMEILLRLDVRLPKKRARPRENRLFIWRSPSKGRRFDAAVT